MIQPSKSFSQLPFGEFNQTQIAQSGFRITIIRRWLVFQEGGGRPVPGAWNNPIIRCADDKMTSQSFQKWWLKQENRRAGWGLGLFQVCDSTITGKGTEPDIRRPGLGSCPPVWPWGRHSSANWNSKNWNSNHGSFFFPLWCLDFKCNWQRKKPHLEHLGTYPLLLYNGCGCFMRNSEKATLGNRRGQYWKKMTDGKQILGPIFHKRVEWS